MFNEFVSALHSGDAIARDTFAHIHLHVFFPFVFGDHAFFHAHECLKITFTIVKVDSTRMQTLNSK